MTNTVTALAAALQDALRYCPTDLPEMRLAIIRENLRLQFDYPGQYVAFVDDWVDAGGENVLARQVIHAGSSYADVWEATHTHPRAKEIVYRFAVDPVEDDEPLLMD